MSNNSQDWYQNPQVYSEIAITAEEIKFKSPKDIEVKCFIPVLTPTMDFSEFEIEAGESTFRGDSGNAAMNSSINYVTLVIPRYIVYQFFDPFKKKNKIPKKTKFIVTSVGGEVRASKMRIIGFYDIGEEEEE